MSTSATESTAPCGAECLGANLADQGCEMNWPEVALRSYHDWIGFSDRRFGSFKRDAFLDGFNFCLKRTLEKNQHSHQPSVVLCDNLLPAMA